MNKPTPEMQEILDTLQSLKSPPIESLTPANARNTPTFSDAVMGVIGKHITKRAMPFPEPVGSISHKLIPSTGGELLARIYYPKETSDKLPIALYFHGGGWVIANLDTYDGSCRALANESGFIFVSVAYRQSPEHPFPAATEDAFAAYKWLLENAHSIGGDVSKIAIVGESAGGNLAAVTCLKAKEAGLPLPIHQVLVYPVTDLTFSGTSHREHAYAKPLNEAMMLWFRNHYLSNVGDAHSPYVSPIFSTQLAGLPEATIITAQLDPLCSDGEMYADRLEMAGVKVIYQRFDGVTHEFFGAKAVLSESKKAIALAAESLKNAANLSDTQKTQPGMIFNARPIIEGGHYATSGEF